MHILIAKQHQAQGRITAVVCYSPIRCFTKFTLLSARWVPLPDFAAGARVLRALRVQIMDLVPSASAVVLQIVLQRLPHKRFEKEMHQHFLHSVFRIAESSQGGPIRDGLLLGVIDRLLEVRPPADSSCAPALCNLTRRRSRRSTWKSSMRI